MVIWQEDWSEEKREKVIQYYNDKLKSFINETVISQESKTFQKRIKKHEDKILHFLTNPNIPFHNNSSEQAIRNTKIHKKVSGCFRSLH